MSRVVDNRPPAAELSAAPAANLSASPVKSGGRLGWLDVVRIITILEIVGFHWLRTCEASNAYGFTWADAYESPQIGFQQLHYLIADQTGPSISWFVNNVIAFSFGFGWEAVNVFVLLSGLGLAMTFRPDRPGFTLGKWYRRRLERILIPYYLISIPLILLAEVLKYVGSGRGGVLGMMAGKLAGKNLIDPIGIELAKNFFLVDPRQSFWITKFFSPAWWFIPPILVGYFFFPLLYRAVSKLGPAISLAASLVISAIAYRLTAAKLLPEHGWYFIILQELCTFILGIVIGRRMATEEGRAKVLAFLSSTNALLVGLGFFIVGNVANWFDLTFPITTPFLAFGFVVILSWIGVKLAAFAPAVSLSRKVDGYHIYLLHQFLAFPMVSIVATIFGARARSLGFSLGFVAYLIVTFLVVLVFEKIWSYIKPSEKEPTAKPRVASA